MQEKTTLSIFGRVKRLDFDKINNLKTAFKSKKMFSTKVGNLSTNQEGTYNFNINEIILVADALEITPHLVCKIAKIKIDKANKATLNYLHTCHHYTCSKNEETIILELI